MDEEINIGVVGMGKMGFCILHTGILISLDGVEVKAVAEKQICPYELSVKRVERQKFTGFLNMTGCPTITLQPIEIIQ